MNSPRSLIQSNSTTGQLAKTRSPSPKATFIQKTRQRLAKKIAYKYSTCQNYNILSEISRTIIDKQCILNTVVKDINFDRQEEKMDVYYPMTSTKEKLPQLIEYYKYYSQRTILLIKEYFPLLYQYQQKRKFIEYKRLKVLLNLSDSKQTQNSLNSNNKNLEGPSLMAQKSRIGISKHVFNNNNRASNKDIQCSNILGFLSFSNLSTNSQNEESLLINDLRNNLSKHIGPSHIKNMSIEQLDDFFQFPDKKQNNRTFKLKNSRINLTNQKNKLDPIKPKKNHREETSANTPQQLNQKGMIRRNTKRNNSCENLIQNSVSRTPYQPATCKVKRKKNLSMGNLCTYVSSPYKLEGNKQNIKYQKVPQRRGDRYQKEKESALASKGNQKITDVISDLKIKIQKEKQRLIKASSRPGFVNLKREKINQILINTANQRFSKKNNDKFREKTVNVN